MRAMKYVGKVNLGEALHTALRKACDSKPTSMAYVLISMMPNDLWGEYLESVNAYLAAVPNLSPANAAEHLKWVSVRSAFGTLKEQKERGFVVPRHAVYDAGSFWMRERDMDRTKPGALRKFIASLPEAEKAGRSDEDVLRERDRARRLFQLSLEMFEDQDWQGFASFLYEKS